MRNYESKTLHTVRHCRHVESPKFSTVIFINEEIKTCCSAKHKIDEQKKNSEPKIDLTKSENSLLKASYAHEIPVKEKSKFTMTNFNNGLLEKVADRGRFM